MCSNADGTRTLESDYATTFTDGDEIGVFAVVGGKVSDAAKNVKMTYDGSSWTGNLVPTATNADKFFENVISQWRGKDRPVAIRRLHR